MKFIKPDWPAPENVTAFTTSRCGGFSNDSFESFNIATHVGDSSVAVSRNRQLLASDLPAGTTIQWLSQVHGTAVVRADDSGWEPDADASWTAATGIACTVMTADCLPVLFCTPGGEKIAAAHAGWRGLNSGILEASVAALGGKSSEIIAWLGPAIGPDAFEVGAEVRAQFIAASLPSQQANVSRCFINNPAKTGYYLADLYQLARIKLAAIGVVDIYGGGLCTFTDHKRFYSYRRDGDTGRMATLIVKMSG